MGRKPNALILEFFERGAKLNDQSNRYQHTCRRCGEVFPKGRPDSLTRHLFEKCPKITDADRARALWQPAEPQMQNVGQQMMPNMADTSMSQMASLSAMANVNEMLPFATQREPSGLDALAEVSRQLQANGIVGTDEAFMAQLQQHIDESDDGHSAGDQTRQGASHTSSATPPRATERADTAAVHAASTATANEQLAESAMQMSQSNPTRPRKRKASSAPGPDPTIPNSYLSYYPQHPPPAVDPQLHQQSQDLQNLSMQSRPARDASSQSAEQPGDDHTPAFTINQGGFGLLQRTNKSKARGRFTEERRKEVQSVRKKGACLRCRMLKKPCSEGTPCGTCKNIESARLWKQACIRTRVADEFGLYSTTYFYCQDRAKVYASLNGVDPRSVNGRIEVTLFPESKLYGTFPALKTNRAGKSADELDLVDNLRSHDDDEDDEDIFLLSFKTEDTLALKLERYIYAAIVECISSEASPIIRSTVELAAELAIEHDDDLLTKFIHLWAATNVLVSREPLWTISYNPRDAPVIDHVTVVNERTDEAKASTQCSEEERVHFAPGDPDYDIMHAQLQDAAERYCQKQAKTCLNELERRLLLRQQSSSFLTFLAAVICLNCVERMTALYYSFDSHLDNTTKDTAPSEIKHGDAPRGDERSLNTSDGQSSRPSASDCSTNFPQTPDWPLPDPPSTFWPQGLHFASLLQLLLRMRGLPPSIHIHDDGSLAILSNFNKAYPVYITSVTEGGDSQQLLAAQWIERTGLNARELWRVYNLTDAQANKDAWGENSEPSIDNAAEEDHGKAKAKGARAWDLRYTASLLLPQVNN